MFETTLVNLKEIFKGGLKKKRDVNLQITKGHDQSFILIIKPQWKLAGTNLVIEGPGLLDVVASGGSWPMTHKCYPCWSLLHTGLACPTI